MATETDGQILSEELLARCQERALAQEYAWCGAAFGWDAHHYQGPLKGSSLTSLTRSIKWPRTSMRSVRLGAANPLRPMARYEEMRSGWSLRHPGRPGSAP